MAACVAGGVAGGLMAGGLMAGGVIGGTAGAFAAGLVLISCSEILRISDGGESNDDVLCTCECDEGVRGLSDMLQTAGDGHLDAGGDILILRWLLISMAKNRPAPNEELAELLRPDGCRWNL